MPITLVLVDDHPLVLNGLEQLLRTEAGFQVLAACPTAEEGWQAVNFHDPDILVLDLMLPDRDGLTLLGQLERQTRPAVVVLTAVEDENRLLDAVRLGARGVVLKAMAPRTLEHCLRAVHDGADWLQIDDVDLSHRLAERRQIETELSLVLTARELELVRLVALGLGNQEIATRLGIGVGTVKIHLHHVYDKLKVDGREDLQTFLRDKRY